MIVRIFLGHHRYECQSRGWHRQAELKVQSCVAHCHAYFVRELVQRTSDDRFLVFEFVVVCCFKLVARLVQSLDFSCRTARRFLDVGSNPMW